MEKYHLFPLRGMRGFILIWIGQLVSMFGTSMTRFALTVWAYQLTGSVTALSLVAFFSFGPLVIMSPIAGALVDRWNRKLVVMLSDIGAGLATAILLVLYLAGNLQIWHLYVAGALAGTFEAFQFPAFSAAMTTMLKQEEYGRASGMMPTAESASAIVGPILAGILLPLIGIGSIMILDILTVAVAVVTILLAFIPEPNATDVGQKAKGNLWEESLFGFRYIWANPSLLNLQMIFFVFNLFSAYGWVLLSPYVLARTGSNELALGTVQSALGLGGIAGGIAMSFWGGPKIRIHGIILGMIGHLLLGYLLVGLGNSLIWWGAGAFLAMFFIPIINGSNQVLWQSKVPADVQGRVFASRILIARTTIPLAMLSAGPLADRLFEPAMQREGLWSSIFSGLVGNGVGSGISTFYILIVALGVLGAALGYLLPAVRHIDEYLPDSADDTKPEPDQTASVPSS